MKGASTRGCAKDLWDKVKEVTGKRKTHCTVSSGQLPDADQLNAHYALQSTDNNYVQSYPKLTVVQYNAYNCISEGAVFNLLDHLKPTSHGSDFLPFWLLKVAACSFAKPITFLFNLSLCSAVIPTQWKKAIITPIPKVPSPTTCSDFRPISLTPILSRLLDKMVVRYFLYPIFQDPSYSHLFNDQYAFRLTGSTDGALISILHHVTLLLASNPYVSLIALDFSKSF